MVLCQRPSNILRKFHCIFLSVAVYVFSCQHSVPFELLRNIIQTLFLTFFSCCHDIVSPHCPEWLGRCPAVLFWVFFFTYRCRIDRSSYHVTNGVFVVTEFIRCKERHRHPSAEFVIKSSCCSFFSLSSLGVSFPSST